MHFQKYKILEMMFSVLLEKKTREGLITCVRSHRLSAVYWDSSSFLLHLTCVFFVCGSRYSLQSQHSLLLYIESSTLYLNISKASSIELLGKVEFPPGVRWCLLSVCSTGHYKSTKANCITGFISSTKLLWKLGFCSEFVKCIFDFQYRLLSMITWVWFHFK